MHSEMATPPTAWYWPSRSGYQPALESVKWLAVACMTIDHVDHFMFGGTQHWMYEIGRLAIPLFSMAFGIGIARLHDWKGSLAKLLAFAAVAQIAWFITDQNGVPNILFTFALALVLVQSYQQNPTLTILMGIVLGVAVEGTYGAIALVLGAYCLERGDVRMGWWYIATGALVTCLLSHSPVPALAVAGFYLILQLNTGPSRRLPSFLYWYYPAHILALGLLGNRTSWPMLAASQFTPS